MENKKELALRYEECLRVKINSVRSNIEGIQVDAEIKQEERSQILKRQLESFAGKLEAVVKYKSEEYKELARTIMALKQEVEEQKAIMESNAIKMRQLIELAEKDCHIKMNFIEKEQRKQERRLGLHIDQQILLLQQQTKQQTGTNFQLEHQELEKIRKDMASSFQLFADKLKAMKLDFKTSCEELRILFYQAIVKRQEVNYDLLQWEMEELEKECSDKLRNMRIEREQTETEMIALLEKVVTTRLGA